MLGSGNGDCDPTVGAGGRVGPVRRHVRIAVARPTLHMAVYRVVEQSGSEEVQRCLRLREVDVLAPAGAVAMVRRGENGGDREARRNGGRVGAAQRRLTVWPADHAVESGDGSAHRTEAGEHRKWSCLPHQAGTEHDQIRLQLPEGVIVQAPGTHRFG